MVGIMNFRFLTLIWLIEIGLSFVDARHRGSMRCGPREDCVAKLIKSDKYNVENHNIVTEDGYIIGIHRIPLARNETKLNQRTRKPVTILLHCFMCSSAVFVVLGPKMALAYMLADHGHDVWMINTRGNMYSKNHIKLSSTSRQYWQYSWHEQGLFDISSSINYIMNVTEVKAVDIVGFSMGINQLFVLLSERPEYNKKIRSITAIAPAVFIPHSKGSFVNFREGFSRFAVEMGASSGMLEMASPSWGLKDMFASICTPNIFFEALCRRLLVFSGGRNNGYISKSALPFFFQFFPESTSLRTFVHFNQIHETGNFQKYSYGLKNNPRIYGTTSPPKYNISRVTTPVNLFWSQGDDLTPPQDVNQLLTALPNITFTYEVPFRRFSHMDFVWSKKAQIVYKEIIKRIQR